MEDIADEEVGLMCNHSTVRDYRYIVQVNQRQCRWCGCTETDKIRQEQQVESSG